MLALLSFQFSAMCRETSKRNLARQTVVNRTLAVFSRMLAVVSRMLAVVSRVLEVFSRTLEVVSRMLAVFSSLLVSVVDTFHVSLRLSCRRRSVFFRARHRRSEMNASQQTLAHFKGGAQGGVENAQRLSPSR